MTVVPYGIIADCFRTGTVIPFLGSAASFVGAPAALALPDANGFAKQLAVKAGYPGTMSDPLSKVAQYVEEIPGDRAYLLNTIASEFCARIRDDYSSSWTTFLLTLRPELLPRLLITTNYDVLCERALAARGLQYLALSHVMRGSKYAGRFLCYSSLDRQLEPSDVWTLRELEEHLLEVAEATPPPVIVYKMHGTSHPHPASEVLDSIVVTESDYVDFLAQDTLKRIPSQILGRLRDSRLLFLGYSLTDWNLRVLLRRINLLQKREGEESGHRHWACVLGADDVEQRFWDRRGVNLYSVSLEIFFDSLAKALQ